MKISTAILLLFLIFEIVLSSRIRTGIRKILSKLTSTDNFMLEEQMLESDNSKYYAKMEDEGNFNVYSRTAQKKDNLLWSSKTGKGKSKGPYKLAVQDDGNLVVLNGSTPIWSSATNGKGNAPNTLTMQDDGNLVYYDSTKAVIWATNTEGK